MATRVDIMCSDRVAHSVGRNLRPDANPPGRPQGLETIDGVSLIENWLVKVADGPGAVRIRCESGVVSASYLAPDSQSGAAVANAFFEHNRTVTMTQPGGRALPFDADRLDSRQREGSDLANLAGPQGILSNRAETHWARPLPGVHGLRQLPMGGAQPNPRDRAEHPAFGPLMRELIGNCDDVMGYTPAAQHGADAVVLAEPLGASSVVARMNVSRPTAPEETGMQLAKRQAEPTGVVMNRHRT